MTQSEFKVIFCTVCTSFTEKVTEDRRERYYEHLKHVPAKRFKMAAQHIEAHDKYFPTIARILEVVNTMTEGSKASGCDLCDDGWIDDGMRTFRCQCPAGEALSPSIPVYKEPYNPPDRAYK